MNILDLAKEIQEELKFFEEHPAKNLDLEQKKYYLNGLALIMNVDDEVHEKEKEYLLTLINTLGLPQSKLNEFIEFAENPSKEIIRELLRVITECELSDIFLVDCLMVSHADGRVKNSEKSLFDIYCDILNVDHLKKKMLIKKVNIDNKREIMKDNNIEHYYLGIYDNIFSNERILINNKTIYDKSTIFINCDFEFLTQGVVLFNSKNVKFISCELVSPKINFSSIKSLEIINSKIIGQEAVDTNIFGENIDKVLIKNTSFENIQTDTGLISFYKSNNSDIRIKNCKFKNCSSNYYDLFSFNKINTLKITSSLFDNCKSSCNLYNHLFNFDVIENLELSDNLFDGSSSFSNRYSHFFYLETVLNVNIENNNWTNCYSSTLEEEPEEVQKIEIEENTKENVKENEEKKENNKEVELKSKNYKYGAFLFYFNKTNIMSLDENTLINCSSPSSLISFRNIKVGKVEALVLKNCKSKGVSLQIVNSNGLEIEITKD